MTHQINCMSRFAKVAAIIALPFMAGAAIGGHEGIPMPLIVGILVGYVTIAGQFIWQRIKHRKGEFVPATEAAIKAGSRGLDLFVAIFLLCAISGYLTRILPVPLTVTLIAHVALFCVTWAFILTNQIRHIATALK